MKQKEEEQSRDVMVEQTADDLIWLCSCAVNGIIPDKARVEKIDLVSVYKLAEEHMLTAVAAYALEAAEA